MEHPIPAPQLAITYVPIERLKRNPKNARRHGKRQNEALKRSITTFGFVVPVLRDADDLILAGHARTEAAAALGITEVPTVQIEHLTAEQARAFTLADNRLSELAEWDDELLARELQELSRLELAFSLEVIGFELPEIDFRIDRLSGPNTEDDDPADIAPKPTASAITRAGDIWSLGERHRVICGDARHATTFERLMAGESAAAAFADAPYNVRVQGHASGLGKTRHREFAMASGEMNEAQYTNFLTEICRNLTHFTARGLILFMCSDWRHVREMLAGADQTGCSLKNICI